MKRVGLYSLIALFSILSFVACEQAQKDAPEVQEEVIAQVEMKVDGMVCAMGCAKFIEEKVAGQEGVIESKVDFESGIAYFSINANAIEAEELEKFIDEIHDGQYDATILSQNEASEEVEEAEEIEEVEETEERDVTAVVNKFQNISFPELLTYFMKRL